MSSQLASFLRTPRRWLWFASAAVFAVVPKCVLCVVAYATAGTLVAGAGREICGGDSTPTLPWISLLVLIAICLAAAAFFLRLCRRSF